MVKRQEISREQAAVVFRRAAEIEQRLLVGDGEVLDMAALEEIGAEVGLSPAAIRQAVVELEAGGLADPQEGCDTVVVERTVPVEGPRVEAEVARLMRKQVMQVKRRFPSRVIWERREGLAADLLRGTDFNRRVFLGEVSEVTVAIVEGSDGPLTHLRIEADMTPARRLSKALSGVGLVVGTVGVTAALVGTGFDPVAAASVPAAGLVALGAHSAGRTRYNRRVELVRTRLERFVDELHLGR